MIKVSSANDVQKLEKISALLTVASYMNKIAEGMDPEGALSEDELIDVVARTADSLTDEEIAQVAGRGDNAAPGSIATAMDNPSVVNAIITHLDQNADAASRDKQNESSVPAEDVQLLPLGQGSVLQLAAGNPHANIGGISIAPDIKIIETQLFTENNNKIAGGNPMSNVKLSPIEQGLLNKVSQLETIVKTSSMLFLKIAEEVETLMAAAQGAQAPATAPSAPATVVGQATVAPLTQDANLVATPVTTSDANNAPELQNKGAVDANPNSDAGKIANYKLDLKRLIKAYK